MAAFKPPYMPMDGPTSQPVVSIPRSEKLKALRIPIIHILALEPRSNNQLVWDTRGKVVDLRELLAKIAKYQDPYWHLSDKAYKELDPWVFPYQTADDREKAIGNAIKAYDRLRLPKDDRLWQKLLPKNERGKGKVLSRLNVTAPAQKPSTPMHKMSKLTEKKATAAKVDEKEAERDGRKAKEPKEPKEPKEKKSGRDDAGKAATAAKATTTKTNTPSMGSTKIRSKKTTASADEPCRHKPKAPPRDVPAKDRPMKRAKPPMPTNTNTNTKPKNPSPLSASPPVNASDFEDSHPVHKALSAAPSPAKTSSGNSDRSLKRKANDIDSSIHEHNLSVKQRKMNGGTPISTPLSLASKANGSTPSSSQSLKRKADDSDRDHRHDSHTPSGSATKHRKVASIDTHLASRYPVHSSNSSQQNNNPSSPGSSSSATSPSFPSLSFRQTVELSQKFQRYYKRYEELYWQLAESEKAPSEQQREDLMKMHRKLEEMKRDIKAGAGKGKA